MSDVGDNNNFMRYIYTGQEDIPRDATHIFISVKVVRARAFFDHRNIVEVICHDKVEKIEHRAFAYCTRLRRVIMPGVKIVNWAFGNCTALTDVECGKLEIVGDGAFGYCKSLRSINLPSARIVEQYAFGGCEALMDAKFGSKLERIDESAFYSCTSLELITIPFKDGLITHDNIFRGCANLNRVNLVEGELLLETVAALQLEEWKNDMYEEIDAINQTVPAADAGDRGVWDIVGEKAVTIRRWIRSVLDKINECKAEHRRVLDEDVAPTLQRVLPQDIVSNSVLPFLELPPNLFE